MLECSLISAEAGASLRDDPQTDHDRPSRPRPVKAQRRPPAATALLTLLFALFAAGGVFFGCIFVTTLADLLAEDGAAPSLPLPVKPSGGPLATAIAQLPSAQPTAPPDPFAGIPVWQSRDRVTFLLLGLDMREDERNVPTRSDTMIILTVDPVHKRAGMLSIPRDLWVPILGHGENKINTAHFFGEMDRPGDGPLLARKTVEYNFGVRINYYARVDFHGFERLVDAVGGVTLDVERPIKDDEYPSEDYGIRRVFIPTGLQHLDGTQALRYARSRHGDNDFARSHRQQAVLLAARNQVLQPSILPRVPQMIGILRSAVQTDVPITDVLPLFNMARGIKSKDIVSRSIDSTMTIDVNGDGTVLVPDRKKIAKVIEEIFGDPPPTESAATTSTPIPAAPTRAPVPTATPTRVPPPTATPTRTPTPASVGSVRVLNGTHKEGLAAAVAERLRARGFEVRAIGNASRQDHVNTVVMDHTAGRSPAALAIVEALSLPRSAVQAAQPAEGGADVTVVLGQDVAQR